MIYFMPICDADQMEEQYRAWIPRLPPARQEKIIRYRFVKDRWLCAAAYMLLLYALEEEFGITVSQTTLAISNTGKPYLSSHPHIHFSLSHCEAGVACGVSNTPIGVDIETIRKFDTNVINRVFSIAEKEILERAENPSLACTIMWTLKESWLKATGEGLSYPLRQLLIHEETSGQYCLRKDGFVAKTIVGVLPVPLSICLPTVFNTSDTVLINRIVPAML